MATISTSIIALNQAEKIGDAISTVLWTDEIVLANSHSTDDTVKIAEGLGARVVQIPLTTFSELRNRAADACSSEWILSLDTDERCTPEVRDEILALLAAGPTCDAYYIPRRNYFMGRWIKGSGWYPNYRQPQLYRKGMMRYTRIIHEAVEMKNGGQIGKLENALWQFPFQNFEEVLPQGQPLLHRRGSHAGAQARVDGDRARARDLGVHQALRLQGRVQGRLGGLRDCLGKFRRNFLPLRQALRGNAIVGPADHEAHSTRHALAIAAICPLDRSPERGRRA